MKRNIKLIFAFFLVAVILVGCNTQKNTNKKNQTSGGKLSGTITAAGSTALQPLAEEAATEFMSNNPSVSITIQGGGSGTGVNQVTSGAVQIGNSDVPAAEKLSDPALAKDLVETKVAGIGYSIIVNKDVTVTSLTLKQIQDIFSGAVTNWKDVGGKDEKINVINRPAASGTRAAFEKTVMSGVKINDSVGTVQDSNGAVEQAINSTPGTISYLANSYLVGDKKNALTIVQIDGNDSSIDNITSGKYPFYSYEYMITKGDLKEPGKSYIDFVKGDDFSAKVEEMGYIPMSKMGNLK
ncbi:phosphate ABC transporter substrate-binding protein PstS family protein [Gottfriedia acidiceleris]|uniref:phosphate ABC transporter substrate-binding protein PstS family protein n=1 Tax=Gottfriedia acidiceleris TaxID=371036 RepID=UPI003D263178